MLPIFDRESAGKALSEILVSQRGQRPDEHGGAGIVLALPRGGVPVAYEIAQRLSMPLDLLIVRKLGVPWHRELAMGAIASGGICVLNDEVLASYEVSQTELDQVIEREEQELARRARAYRGDRPWPELRDKSVIIVDDGLATGATMKAGIFAVRERRPRDICVAVPVASPESAAALRELVDQVVCLKTPAPFFSIGQWYENFRPVGDDQVQKLLQRAWRREMQRAPGNLPRRVS